MKAGVSDRLVIDASVTISWCFEDETSKYSDFILDYVRANTALVPSLWLSELTNGLLTAIKKKRLDFDGSLAFLEKISRLPIRIATLSSREYFTNVFQLATNHHLTTYDATYLYLAIKEKAPLATNDSDLKLASRNKKLPKLAAK